MAVRTRNTAIKVMKRANDWKNFGALMNEEQEEDADENDPTTPNEDLSTVDPHLPSCGLMGSST